MCQRPFGCIGVSSYPVGAGCWPVSTLAQAATPTRTVNTVRTRSLRVPSFEWTVITEAGPPDTTYNAETAEHAEHVSSFFCEFSGFSVDRRRSAVSELARTG